MIDCIPNEIRMAIAVFVVTMPFIPLNVVRKETTDNVAAAYISKLVYFSLLLFELLILSSL